MVRQLILPMPHAPEHTEYIKAGALTFGVEFRVLDDQAPAAYRADEQREAGRALEDRGVSIHVFGNVGGELVEYLRFDCFDEEPHYHYIFPEEKVQDWMPLDTTAEGEALPWALERLSTRLAAMLTRAEATELAQTLNQRELEAALPKLALAAEEALQRNSSLSEPNEAR